MKPSLAIFFAAWALVLSMPAVAATRAAPPPVSQARVAALQQQRFGMFICWSFSTFGPHTRQLLCVVGWGDRHDARKVVSDAANAAFGIYGFSRPLPDSLPRPIETYLTQSPESFKGNDRNIAVLARLFNGKPQPPPASPARETRLQWFHEAKYGFFINWGLYSIPAGEWKGKPIAGIGEWIMNRAKIPVKEYEQLAARFNPTKFDADAWAQLALDAGMKYVVFDCKHHDGFALYRSEVSKYNCYDATPWKRDPFKELQAACAKRGLKLCFYYSQAQDWHEPNGAGNDWDFGPDNNKDFDRYLREKSLPQVRELLTGYGPIGLIWFDTPRLMTPARGKQFTDLVRSLQPETLINSRLLLRGSDISSLTAEQIAQAAEAGWDYTSRGDNEIPHAVTPGAWETAATVNDTWGFKKDDHNWKSPEDICFKLVDIVSKGGNYLLNVGPDAEGFIPQPSQDILRKVGAWLKVNGEAIYGAGRTPFGAELGTVLPGEKDKRGRPPFAEKKEWRCTTKPGRLYLHLFKWPAGLFEMSGVTTRITKAFLLADHERTPLPLTQNQGQLVITLPAKAPDAIASVLCLEY